MSGVSTSIERLLNATSGKEATTLVEESSTRATKRKESESESESELVDPAPNRKRRAATGKASKTAKLHVHPRKKPHKSKPVSHSSAKAGEQVRKESQEIRTEKSLTLGDTPETAQRNKANQEVQAPKVPSNRSDLEEVQLTANAGVDVSQSPSGSASKDRVPPFAKVVPGGLEPALAIAKKSPGVRGKADPEKARKKMGAHSSENVRFLIRLGLLPIVCHPNHLFRLFSAFVSTNESLFQYTRQSNRDPFVDFRNKDGVVPSEINSEDAGLFIRLKESQDVRVAIARDMRKAMYDFASDPKVFGAPENHVVKFSEFDIVECCHHFEVRELLLKNPYLLKERCGDRSLSFDFERRAQRGIDILAMVFIAILIAFRQSWFTPPRRSRDYMLWLVPPNLYKKVRESLKRPTFTREWVRILLFSCTALADEEETEEYKALFRIAENYEHLALLQLGTILTFATDRTSQLETGSQSSCSRSEVFTYRNVEATASIYVGKKEPFPWNRRLLWAENTDDLRFVVPSANGKHEIVQQARHEHIAEIISRSRRTLVSKCNLVCLPEVRSEKDGWIDIVADLVVERCYGITTLVEKLANEPKFTSLQHAVHGRNPQYDEFYE